MDKDAVASFHAALRINPATGGGGTNKEVIDLCKRALENEPRLWDAVLLLGAALRRDGEIDGASRIYREALARHIAFEDEDSPRATMVLELASTFVSRGEFVEALETLDKESEVKGSRAGAIMYAEVLTELGRVNDALRILPGVEGTAQPVASQILVARARASLRSGEHGRAREAIIEVFQIDPLNPAIEPLLPDVGLRIERDGEQLQLFDSAPTSSSRPGPIPLPRAVEQRRGRSTVLWPSGAQVVGMGIGLAIAGGLFAMLTHGPLWRLITQISFSREWQLLAQAAPWALCFALAGIGGRLRTGRGAVGLGALTGVVWLLSNALVFFFKGPLIPVLLRYIVTFAWSGCTLGIAYRDRRRAVGGAVGGGIGGALTWVVTVLLGVEYLLFKHAGDLVGALIAGALYGTFMWLGIVLGEKIATRKRA